LKLEAEVKCFGVRRESKAMFATRRVLQAVVASVPARQKTTTGLTGIKVHPDPLPALRDTYSAILQLVRSVPHSALYRQSLEALLTHKLAIVQSALEKDGPTEAAVTRVEKEIGDGQQIEEVIIAAEDELSLTEKMLEWKPWEPLEEKPLPGQWEYFGTETRS